jgi:hypothetical protein
MFQLRGRASALLLLLVPAMLPAASAIPGGVLDPNERAAYFSSTTGIDAVALANGELLWSTKEAQVPLFVAGDRLFALALTDLNRLYVRGFDVANGGRAVYQSAPVEFPGWVVTGEAPGRSFRFTWQRHKTILDLNWQAGAWAESGPRKQSAGEVRIDLEKGTVKTGRIGAPPTPPSAAVPALLENLSVRWHRSISGHLHALVLEEAPAAKGERKQRMMLRIWNEQTGKESKPRELLCGSRPVVLTDPNGLHLWLRDAAPSPDELGTNDAPGRVYGWKIWSVLDGHLVARLPFVPGTQQATLIGERAYCLVTAPQRGVPGAVTRRSYTLYAIDVGTGKTLWQRSLSSKALVP